MRLLGVLCVALVVMSGTLSVTHPAQHEGIPHADCSLCLTAHAVVQEVAAPAEILISQVFTAVIVTQAPAPRRLLARFALFSRPPPAEADLS